MIVELGTAPEPIPATQVAILGAGAVGIVLAVTLARRGIKVTLCESGGATVEGAMLALNDAVVVGRPHEGIKAGRARQLGGTTTLWGGQLVPFRQVDFEPRPWLDLDGWPIQRLDVSSYYKAAAEMLGLQVTTDEDNDIWEHVGSSTPRLGDHTEVILTRWLRQPNFARLFQTELAKNPNITVLLHANAVGFESSGYNATLSGVTLRESNGKVAILNARQIVIATGTIEASRLMLASLQLQTNLPWQSNDNIGAKFQDHLDLRVADVSPLDKKRFHQIFDNIYIKGFKYNPKVTLSSEVQKSREITNIAGSFVFESSLSEHIANVKMFLRAVQTGALPPDIKSLPSHLKALGKVWWPLVIRYLKDNRAYNPADLGIGLRLHCEQKPLATSRIRLDSSRRDRHGVPLVSLDWRVDGVELKSMSVFCETLNIELKKTGLANLILDPKIANRDGAILDDARDTNHHCGGLVMASSQAEGVVDRDCRVFGTRNLFVAGAAVFPSSSFANPTFTAIALALRLADLLALETDRG